LVVDLKHEIKPPFDDVHGLEVSAIW
jgi:hypothetical protein